MQESIQTVLLEMVLLLRNYYDASWGDVYDRLAQSIALSPQDTARRILASYGGMGSINDVVLTSGGQPLREENRRFDMLRSRLSQLCLQSLNGPDRSDG